MTDIWQYHRGSAPFLYPYLIPLLLLHFDQCIPVHRRRASGSCLKGIDLQTKACPCCAHGWPWLLHNVQPAGKNDHSNLNRIVSRPSVASGRFCIAPQTVFQLTRCSRRTILLKHKFRTAWAIEMTADTEEWSELPISATTATYTIGQEHQ